MPHWWPTGQVTAHKHALSCPWRSFAFKSRFLVSLENWMTCCTGPLSTVAEQSREGLPDPLGWDDIPQGPPVPITHSDMQLMSQQLLDGV